MSERQTALVEVRILDWASPKEGAAAQRYWEHEVTSRSRAFWVHTPAEITAQEWWERGLLLSVVRSCSVATVIGRTCSACGGPLRVSVRSDLAPAQRNEAATCTPICGMEVPPAVRR